LVLAALAGAVGMLLSYAAAPLLDRFAPSTGDIPIRPDGSWSWLPLLYTVLVSVVAGIATGLAPAMRATRVDVYPILKGAGSSAGRKRHLMQSTLVLAQVAGCVIVLICGGLFVRSLQQLASYDLGFQPDRLVMASVDLGLQGYSEQQRRQFFDRLTEQVRALPGVETAAIATSVPFDTYFETRGIVPVDLPTASAPAPNDDAVKAGVNHVDPAYFETLGVTLLQGRGFSEQDADSSRQVAVMNQTLADRLWPGQEPLGKQFRWESSDSSTAAIEVVGVVKNGKYVMLGEASRPYLYLALAPGNASLATLHVRTQTTDPLSVAPSLRGVFRDLDADLPIFNVRSMEEHLRTSTFAFLPLRMGALLAGVQGILALLLAVIGIYGVVAYAVSQQTRDIGIRIALGANNHDVFRLVSRSGLRPTLLGLTQGLAASFGLARLLAVLLYGLNPVSIPLFTAVIALVLAVSLLACWLPARRALRVDPIEALRQE
jgi:predicted permease